MIIDQRMGHDDEPLDLFFSRNFEGALKIVVLTHIRFPRDAGVFVVRSKGFTPEI